MRRRGVSPLFIAASVLVLLVALVLTACGGGGGSSSSAESTSSASSGEEASGGFDLAEWEKKTEEYEQGPTTYEGPTEPVEVPKGKKLAWIPCSGAIRGCVRPVEAAGEIAEELGWSVKSYDGKGTPQGMNAAVTNAVAGGAEVILTGGVDPHFISSGLKQAREQGVLVASMSQGVKPEPNGYPFDIGANYTELGTILGTFVVAHSEGKAVMLPFDDKSYESTMQFVEASEATVEECPECEVLPTEWFVGTDIETTLGPRLVSLLRQNPDITYVQGSYDPAATGMVPAIANAGLAGKVSVVAGLGNEQNLQYVKEGQVQVADAGFDNLYMGYMALYQVSRMLNEEELWETPGVSEPEYKYSGRVPIKLFTENNTTETGDYTANDTLNYIPKFEELLGLK